jgi:hypothetical protein
MEGKRGEWNERQGQLRGMLESDTVPPEAIDLFVQQHAALHLTQRRGEAAGESVYSFADEVLDGLTPEQMRRIPPGGEHSIAWIWWHLARIEDMTMNVLVAGNPQLADEENWFKRLHTPLRDSGNEMDIPAVQQLSDGLDIDALLAYRSAVGRRTDEIVRALPLSDLHKPVDSARLQHLLEIGAVKEEARSVLDYWGKRDIAGLLLMPPTRHCFVHLTEAMKIKGKVARAARFKL